MQVLYKQQSIYKFSVQKHINKKNIKTSLETHTKRIPISILRLSYNTNFQEAINKILGFSNKHKHQLKLTYI